MVYASSKNWGKGSNAEGKNIVGKKGVRGKIKALTYWATFAGGKKGAKKGTSDRPKGEQEVG